VFSKHIKVCSLQVQLSITQIGPHIATTVHILLSCIRQRCCVIVIAQVTVFVLIHRVFAVYRPGGNLFIEYQVANRVSTNTSYLQ